MTGRPTWSEPRADHDPAPGPGHPLARALSTAARRFRSEPSVGAQLDHLVTTAVRLVPGARDAAAKALDDQLKVTVQRHTSELARQIDAVQVDAGEGPYLDTVRGQQTVLMTDTDHERRWPTFTSRARSLGVGSMLALPLHVRGRVLGVLVLCSPVAGALDDESEQVAQLLACHAAVALARARRLNQLNAALESRDLVGQARGMLMQRYAIDRDQASAVLKRVSRTTHRKLDDVARELVLTGQLPGLRPPPTS